MFFGILILIGVLVLCAFSFRAGAKYGSFKNLIDELEKKYKSKEEAGDQ